MRILSKFTQLKRENYIVLFICFLFFVAYLTLSLVKHLHYQTGYDLSVDSQIVWEYSRFLSPISTVHAYAFTSVFWDHIEFIYVFLSPFYWILSDAKILLVLQAVAITISGFPIFFLTKKYKLNNYLSFSILISYFLFFGIQNALWSDVHSLVFGTSFLAFFIYFLENRNKFLTIIFFLLAITSKEDIGLLTFLISFVHFIKTKEKIGAYLMILSAIYLFAIFFVYFPNFTPGYRFADKQGLLSKVNLLNFFNNSDKREVIFYTLNSYGFLPLLNPLFLLPYIGDLAHYFVLGNDTTTAAQTIFLHYRVSDAVLLVWPLILVLGKYKKLNNKYFSLYILFFAIITTYLLHSPLTYFTKKWFWVTPSGVTNINKIINYLPSSAYVVTQTNISAHISNRKLIVTMFGDKKDFKFNSPCRQPKCEWFKWAGKPNYLLVDTSPEWNITNLLANRSDFIAALSNMEKGGNIRKYKQIGSSIIYLVNKQPY